jgi:hypothetical protein
MGHIGRILCFTATVVIAQPSNSGRTQASVRSDRSLTRLKVALDHLNDGTSKVSHGWRGDARTPRPRTSAYCTVIVSIPDRFCAEAPLSEITLLEVIV